MNLTFQIETTACKDDIEPLLALHYDELCQHKEAMALVPDWDKYRFLEQHDKLLAFTVRDSGKLIGYAVFFVDAHIHYSDTLIANNDIIFLHKDYRNKVTPWTVFRSVVRRALRIPKRTTSIGEQLIVFSEQQLKNFGVNKVIWHIKFKLNWGGMMLRRGYEREDFTVSKII